MGQDWYLFNIDRRKQGPGFGEKLGECFPESDGDLLRMLRIPCMPRETESWLAEGETVIQPGPLGKLSTELLDMIFDALCDAVGVVMFSLSCKAFLAIGQCHILAALKDLHAPWSNGRLIILGQYTRGRDRLPKGLLTDAEWDEIVNEEMPELGGPGYTAQGLPDFALERYEYTGGRHNLRYRVCNALLFGEFRNAIAYGRHDYDRSKETPERRRDYDMFVALVEAQYPPGPRVLCNVSKREYVREDTLNFPLQFALTARIAWSSSPSISMCCSKECINEFTHGPWAGDRFVVATMETLPELGEGLDGWTDATEGVDKLLRHLWKENKMDRYNPR